MIKKTISFIFGKGNNNFFLVLPLGILVIALILSNNIFNLFPFKSTLSAPASVDVSIDVGTTSMVSKLIVGTTYVDDFLTGNSTAVARAKTNIGSAIQYHNQHIMGFGVLNPWPDPGVENPSTTSPTTLPTNSTLAGLDARIRLAKEMGGEPVVTLCCAPDWMKVANWRRSTYNYANYTNWNVSVLETAPLPEHEDEFAQLTAIIAKRYDGTTADPLNVGNTLPKVTYFQVWNEMKGFWYDPAYSTTTWSNNYDGERYTRMYNLIWTAVKAERPDAKLGGPYFVVEATGSRTIAGVNTSAWWSADPITTRQRQILDYFLTNRQYADGDFLIFDRAIQSTHDTTDSVGAGTPTPLPEARIYNSEVMFGFTHWFKDISTQAQARSGYQGEPIWFAEDYINASGRSAIYERAALASMLYNHVKAGTSVSLRWDPEDDSGMLGQHLVTEVNSNSTGGQTTPNHEVYMNFKNNFERGTPIYQTTVSSNTVEVLASADKIMLVNKNTVPVPVNLETTNNKIAAFTLGSMEVKFLNYSDLSTGPLSYYVDCTAGNDSNNGLSAGAAWSTLTNVNDASSTDGDAAFVMNPGDTLYLKRGCTWTGPLNARWTGTSTDPITITAYGSGNLPIIQNASSANVSITGDYQIIEYIKTYHSDASYPATFTDIYTDPEDPICTRPLAWKLGFGIADGAEYNTIQYIEATNHAVGVNFADTANNNKVLHSYIYDNKALYDVNPDGTNPIGQMAVLLHGTGNEIGYNRFESTAGSASCTGQENSIEIYRALNSNIHHNTSNDRVFSEMGSYAAAGTAGISTNNTFAYNLHFSNYSKPVGSSSSIKGMRFIVTRGNGHTNGPVRNTKIYNNTVYYTGLDSQAVICENCNAGNGEQMLTLRNNIIWAEKGLYIAESNSYFTERNNIFWDNDGTSQLQQCIPSCSNFSPDASSLRSNPDFKSTSLTYSTVNTRLESTSAAIDIGVTGLGYTIDLDDTSVPYNSVPDVGAYEYVPAPTNTPTPTNTATPTPTNTPTPTLTNTPTPTPTGVGSTTPTAPVVTLNVSSISGSISTGNTAITIGWTNPTNAAVRWVDISAASNFSTYYHKLVNSTSAGTTISTNGPDAFTINGGSTNITLSPGTTYYVRLWNGVHSTSTSFSIPQTPTSTPSPTNTPTPTLTSTPIPTSTPAVELPTLSPDPHADNTPILSGTASSSTTTIANVEYQMNSTSGTWENCSANDATFNSASEQFTCTVAALLDGLQTIHVRVTDANTLTTIISDTFTIDTTDPNISVSTIDNDLTNDNTPAFFGNAVDVSSIIQSVDYQIGTTSPGSWTNCTADDSTFDESSEDFTCSVGSTLPDGSKTVYFRATDDLAHTMTSYTTLSFTVDTTAATINLIDLSPSITADTTPMLSGTVVDSLSTIALVQYQIGATLPNSWSSCSANDGTFNSATESFSCTVSSGLSSGSHTMYVRSTDAAGNVNAGSSIDSSTFTIDITAPTFTIVPLSPDPSSDVTPTLGGTAMDTNSNIATVQFQVDSTSGSWSSCSAVDSFNSTTESFTCTAATLTNGSHTMYFKGTDTLGNVTSGTFPSDTFSIDNTPPEVTLNTFVPNPTNDNTPTFTGSVSTDVGTIVSVEYQVSGTAPGSWNACTAIDASFNSANENFSCNVTTLTDNDYIMYIRAQDSTGNQTSSNYTQQAFSVDTVDPINPGVNLVAISPDPTNDLSISIGGTATDADGTITNVEFQMDGTGGAWTSCTATDTSFNSATELFNCDVGSTLSQGSHTIYVRATDNDALNSASAQDTFVFDSVVSTITLTALSPDPTSDNTPTLGGTAVDTTSTVLSVEFQIGATAPGSWTNCSANDGTFDEASEIFSCTPSSALSNGSNTMFVRSTDAAGNVTTGANVKSDIFTVDTAAPVLTASTVTDPSSDNTPTIGGTAVDTYGTVLSIEYQVDSTSGSWNLCTANDSDFDESTEDFSCDIDSALTSGIHTVYIRATDSLSTVTSSDSYYSDSFTVDADAPTVTISALAADPSSDNTPTFTGTVTDTTSTVSTVEYQLDTIFGSWNSCSATTGSFDSTSENYTCNVGSTVSNGIHTIYIRTTDALGNETSPDENINEYTNLQFTIDTVAPVISLTSLSPDPTFDNTPSLTGRVTDAYSSILAVQYQVDSTSGTWLSCTSDDGSFDTVEENYTCTVSSELDDGSHTINIRTSDYLSNTTSTGNYESDTFVVNAQGPVITDTTETKTETTAHITWQTDENGSTKLQYGLLPTEITTETAETDTTIRVTDHEVSLISLVPCTTYQYVVRSIDSNGLETVGDTESFTTEGCTGNTSIVSQSYEQLLATGDSMTLLNDGTNGITLTVPASFYSTDLYFQIKKLNKSSVLAVTSSPSGFTAVNDFIYDLRSYEDVNTQVTNFDELLTIQMTYRDADISNFTENTLQIYTWDGTSWTALTGCSKNESSNTISCTTNHFTVFALFGVYVPPSNNSNSSGGGSSGGSSSNNVCSNQKPGSTPHLFQVDRTGNKATMHFAPSEGPYDGYILSFGHDEAAEQYNGIFDIRNSTGAIVQEVDYLDPGSAYYFKVKAKNGCTSGDWSNIIRTKGVNARSTAIVSYYPTWVETVSYYVNNAVSTVTSVLPGKKQTDQTITQPTTPAQPEQVQQPVAPKQPTTPKQPNAPRNPQPQQATTQQSGNWFTGIINRITSIFR